MKESSIKIKTTKTLSLSLSMYYVLISFSRDECFSNDSIKIN